jgi:hypothetical protein
MHGKKSGSIGLGLGPHPRVWKLIVRKNSMVQNAGDEIDVLRSAVETRFDPGWLSFAHTIGVIDTQVADVNND